MIGRADLALRNAVGHPVIPLIATATSGVTLTAGGAAGGVGGHSGNVCVTATAATGQQGSAEHKSKCDDCKLSHISSSLRLDAKLVFPRK